VQQAQLVVVLAVLRNNATLFVLVRPEVVLLNPPEVLDRGVI